MTSKTPTPDTYQKNTRKTTAASARTFLTNATIRRHTVMMSSFQRLGRNKRDTLQIWESQSKNLMETI